MTAVIGSQFNDVPAILFSEKYTWEAGKSSKPEIKCSSMSNGKYFM